MSTVREPVLITTAIAELRPTQITVGMREVLAKRQRWREIGTRKGGGEFLGKHMIPVILGPKLRHYVIDHHHLARALHDEGVKNLAVTVIADLSALDSDAFWTVMDNRNWMHPFDAKGRRCHYRGFPRACPSSSTIRFDRSPANCAGPAALPRIRHPSANSSGPIFCVGA